MKSLRKQIKYKIQNCLQLIIDRNISIRVEDAIHWNTKVHHHKLYTIVNSISEKIHREIIKAYN